MWSKADHAALGMSVPKAFSSKFRVRRNFQTVCKRDVVAQVPAQPELAEEVVRSFLDLYAYERDWPLLKAHAAESNELLANLREQLFVIPTVESVAQLVRARAFSDLAGRPRNWKNAVSRERKAPSFQRSRPDDPISPVRHIRGLCPWTIAGRRRCPPSLSSPLRRVARSGVASSGSFLLVIDELNRADLGKVLGEAIYLFEPGEVGGKDAREIRLPYAVNGSPMFRLPESLYVLGTIDTADRSLRPLT